MRNPNRVSICFFSAAVAAAGLLACSANDTPQPSSSGGSASGAANTGGGGASAGGAAGASGVSGGAAGTGGAGATGGSSTGGSGGASSATGGGTSAGAGGVSGGAPPMGSGGSAVNPGDAAVDAAREPAARVDAATVDVARADASGSREASTESGAAFPTGGCGSAKVCDDFEAYTAAGSLAPWTTAATGGSLKVDTTHAWSGTQAILVHADSGANRRAQLLRTGSPLFPAQPNLFWGRMMVYPTNLPPSNVHYDNIQADGTGTGQYRIGGMGGILLNYEPHDCYQKINTPIPQNKWTCWQWLYDGSQNTIEFYIDGVLQTKVNSTGQGCVDGTNSVWAAPTFTTVRLGWINFQSMPSAVDLWIDDVALGAERISCPAAGPAAH